MDMNDREDEVARLDEEMLNALISLAGEGPPVPSEGKERTRRALRPLWLGAVRSRRRVRIYRTAVGLAAAILLVLAISVLVNRQPSAAPTHSIARVEAIRGEAWAQLPSEPERVALTTELSIPIGTTLISGTEGRIALRLSTGHEVRVDRNTEMILDRTSRLRLVRGAVYVDSGSIASSGLRVVTPIGEASDVGTRFEVRYEHARLQVLVRSGAVRVDLSSEEIQVDSGRGVVVPAGGDPEWMTIEPDGSAWDWAQEITPPFQVEGRTVEAFLKWYEKETGRRVRFVDPETERLASETTLHGSTLEVAPDAAAEGVLMSAGLTGSVSDGEMRVQPID